MTDTAVSTTTAPAKPPQIAAGPVAALVPQNIEEAYRLAQALALAGDMVPKQFQGQPQAIMAAMLKGMEVGLAPMQALANIAVINGRATLWGDALPALVQRAGHHIDVVIVGSGEQMVATATLERSDGRKIERRFSWQDANRAGLTEPKTRDGRPIPDSPWIKYLPRMLSMRARTWAIRDGAADALMGLEVAEEVADYGPDRARDVTPPDAPAASRGGVVYREAPQPEQPVDEILEHHDSLPTPEEIEEARRRVDEELARRDAEYTEPPFPGDEVKP